MPFVKIGPTSTAENLHDEKMAQVRVGRSLTWTDGMGVINTPDGLYEWREEEEGG